MIELRNKYGRFSNIPICSFLYKYVLNILFYTEFSIMMCYIFVHSEKTSRCIFLGCVNPNHCSQQCFPTERDHPSKKTYTT